ncbi:heme lyase CcmF/NrfE family subunit [Celeribacter halophilus]|uniref:Cytochrome c-type biogenesis protein CcmF n=1 Tax=Celeribacter halophilus TaxID=576117 RepID=A0A1I3NY29_9RHOB|nr:heme lyase CcmF/NrfE family subunit [Celeribacter halophilus]PZX14678.1 cytochrome c-type biogenesis protein CcmF [Celeribacter halophilus]SFJ13930.1 cytochrome c-type biogenesis protein CcmF [Celeribacter halophilus]
MLVELGHFALVLAFAVALAQTVLPLWGAQTRNPALMAVGEPAAMIQFVLVTFSFGVLTYAFVTSDFSLKVVMENSHTLKPMLYKVSGVWGNHEGSMLLWVLILALFGATAALFGGNIPATLRARVIGIQGSIGVAFLAFILFTSNPFVRLAIPPMNGQDLNPLLQDPGLAFHPPFLYLGYVGLSMTFSFAVAALLEGRVDAAWGRWVRPWTLAAWVFLTIGIGLGSWWAYYELGWGGFWFWDPVENASLMPWLFAAALLHSAIVVEKRETLKSWTILLAIMAFGFSLIGTFLVRSGVITSVHAFANDPERGVFILLILAVFMGGALALFTLRAGVMQAKGVFALVSRESALVMNNILLAVSSLVVFIGTIWPLVAEALWARKLSVGAPFFDAAFTPFFVALAILLPIGAILPWKRAKLGASVKKLLPSLILAFAVLGLIWSIQTQKTLLGPIGLALGTWLVAGAVQDILLRTGKSVNLSRLSRLPRADWGRLLAHGGLGITMAGISGLTAWTVEDIRVVQIGESFDVAGYTIALEAVERQQGPNYITTMATMEVFKDAKHIATLHPEKRSYPVAQMPTTEAGIDNGFLRDIYLVIGDIQSNGGWAVRTYIKPLANWIWGGTIIMALGGFLSLTDRRYRVAAGARKAQTPRKVTAKGVPAE